MNLKPPLIKYNCPYCGQQTTRPALGDVRGRQQRIYEAVSRAGENGISSKDLLVRMYSDDEWPTPGGPTVLRVMIHELNKVLKKHGQRIDGRWGKGYRLESLKD